MRSRRSGLHSNASSSRKKPQADRQFASSEEICLLHQALRDARDGARTAHESITDAWRGPLSLFGQREEAAAFAAGVGDAHVAAVRDAQTTVAQTVELCDLSDVYDAQLELLQRSPRQLVLRAPLVELIERLDAVAARLETHVPYVRQARLVFDAPALAATPSNVPAGTKTLAGRAGSADCERPHSDDDAAELPVLILQDTEAQHAFPHMPSAPLGTATAAAVAKAGRVADSFRRKSQRRFADLETLSKAAREDAKAFATGTRLAALGLLGYPVSLGSGEGEEVEPSDGTKLHVAETANVEELAPSSSDAGLPASTSNFKPFLPAPLPSEVPPPALVPPQRPAQPT